MFKDSEDRTSFIILCAFVFSGVYLTGWTWEKLRLIGR